MDPVQMTFTFSKSTKNTHVYTAPEKSGWSGSLYLQKAAAADEPPKTVTATVQVSVTA